jgi:DNA polymerase III epsilon subunit-like protein
MSFVPYVCDTETTGTDNSKHDIVEICMWRLTDDQVKTWHLKPLNAKSIKNEALRVNKHKREDILHQTEFGRETYKDPAIILPDIEMWLMEDGAAAEDRVFIGQNPKFDYDFLLVLWNKMGADDSFPFGQWFGTGEDKRNQGFIIDTIDLVKFIDLCIGKIRPRYNLGSLVKDFGIKKAQAHRADGDVKMTKELFLKIFETFKPLAIEAFGNEDSV